jgi:hypothetical protein
MWLPIADATKTPLWLTIILTVVAGAVAVVSAAISARASRKAARIARGTANMERFAVWQMHKREVYATFLSAGIAVHGPDDRAFEAARSAVMLTADVETREVSPGLQASRSAFRSEDARRHRGATGGRPPN